jgi:AGZA family xanthine/uracil permease-like MFS transporter
MISGDLIVQDLVLHPVIAPALVIVGYLMLRSVKQIDWDDVTEAIPAFLAIVIMPLTASITEGIAFGFISYAVLKLATGRGRKVHALVYVFSALFILRYFLK